MSQLYSFNEFRKTPRRVFFDRAELNQLLSLYSRNVASGEWRDYAIDQRDGMAIFSVFRHTHDRPLFSIAKRSGPPEEFVVMSGRKGLRRVSSLEEALRIFDKKIKIVR